jgi:hypothetical protein
MRPMTVGTLGTHYAITQGGLRLRRVRGTRLKAGVPAEVIVGPPKKIRRRLVGNSL